MLRGNISLYDLDKPPQITDSEIRIGKSLLCPIIHSAIETILVSTIDQWFLTIREKQRGSQQKEKIAHLRVSDERFAELYQSAIMWPLDYIIMEIAIDGTRLRLKSGAYGSVPLYIYTQDDTLFLSWNFVDLLRKPMLIDREVAVSYLALDIKYSARQICSGIYLLTERASFYMEPGQSRFLYPPAAPIPDEQPVTNIIEAEAGFISILEEVLNARPIAPGKGVIELSGGRDSATVAALSSRILTGLKSIGIIVEGDVGQIQARRRQKLVDICKLTDTAIQISEYIPSLTLIAGGEKQDHPFADFYLEAFQAIWSAASQNGGEFLLSGVGGDELSLSPNNDPTFHSEKVRTRNLAEAILTAQAIEISRASKPFDAPEGPVPSTALLASVSHASFNIEHGLWPVNPLSDPRIVAYMYSLPEEYRYDRLMIHRILEKHFGLETFPRNYCKETFAEVLPKRIALQAATIAGELRECALADLGLVELPSVLRMLRKVEESNGQYPTQVLVFFLWLERFVRQAM